MFFCTLVRLRHTIAFVCCRILRGGGRTEERSKMSVTRDTPAPAPSAVPADPVQQMERSIAALRQIARDYICEGGKVYSRADLKGSERGEAPGDRK